MSGYLAGAMLAVGVACVIEGLLLFGRAQLLLNRAEELLSRIEPPLLTAEPEVDTDEMPVIERPRPTPGPRTVPEAEAIGRVADVDFAWELARIEDGLHTWRAEREAA